jgi:hypothetical protein
MSFILAIGNFSSTTTRASGLAAVAANPLFLFLAGLGSILFIVYFIAVGWEKLTVFLEGRNSLWNST